MHSPGTLIVDLLYHFLNSLTCGKSKGQQSGSSTGSATGNHLVSCLGEQDVVASQSEVTESQDDP
jgi:hypothetical protein